MGHWEDNFPFLHNRPKLVCCCCFLFFFNKKILKIEKCLLVLLANECFSHLLRVNAVRSTSEKFQFLVACPVVCIAVLVY